MSSNLKQQLIRLGDQKPSLREHLRSVLSHIEKRAGWDEEVITGMKQVGFDPSNFSVSREWDHQEIKPSKSIQGVKLLLTAKDTKFDGTGQWRGRLQIDGTVIETEGRTVESVAQPLYDILYKANLAFSMWN